MTASVDQSFGVGKFPDDVHELGHDVFCDVGADADAAVNKRQLQEVVSAAVSIVAPPVGIADSYL